MVPFFSHLGHVITTGLPLFLLPRLAIEVYFVHLCFVPSVCMHIIAAPYGSISATPHIAFLKTNSANVVKVTGCGCGLSFHHFSIASSIECIPGIVYHAFEFCNVISFVGNPICRPYEFVIKDFSLSVYTSDLCQYT